MKFRKRLKRVKAISLILKIIGIILFVFLVCYLLYIGSNGEKLNLEVIEKTVFPIATVLLIVIMVLIFTLGPLVRHRYIKNIKNNYEKRRFKYIDTFFYKEWRAQGGDYTGHSVFTFYHVIEDCNSKKLYVLFKDASNSQVEVNFDGNSTVFRGQGLRTNWQRVNYNDEGDFWIKEELPDFYKRDNEEIILNFEKKYYYFKNNQGNQKMELFKNKRPIIYNRNQDYDISLLDKATFVDGYMEFDMK